MILNQIAVKYKKLKAIRKCKQQFLQPYNSQVHKGRQKLSNKQAINQVAIKYFNLIGSKSLHGHKLIY